MEENISDSHGDGIAVPPPVLRGLKIIIPVLIAVLAIVVLNFGLDPQSFLIVTGLMVAYILPPAGKETVIPAGILLGIPWWAIVAAIVTIDLTTALFMNWNFDLVHKIPYLGGIMEGFIKKAEDYIREEPRLPRLYFTGIVVLVMSPVMGSGGIRGSIIGQLIGMTRGSIVAAVLTGSVLGCLLIAFGTLLFREVFIQSLVAGTVIVLLLVTVVVVFWLVRIRRRRPS